MAEDELEAFHRHALGQGKSGESVTGGVEGEVVRDSGEDSDPLQPLV